MEFAVNEVSLQGQFQSVADFLPSLRSTILLLKLIQDQKLEIYKYRDLYKGQVSKTITLYEVLKDKSDEVLRFKSQLVELCNTGNFIEEESPDSVYHALKLDVSQSSLKFAFEFDLSLVSFPKSIFDIPVVTIKKDNVGSKDLVNNFDVKEYASHLFSESKISVQNYCEIFFSGTKICFDKMDSRFGFNNLDNSIVSQFVSQLKLFSRSSWEEIHKSDGLDFKKFSPDIAFKGVDKGTSLNKFRIDQKMRCFGYRSGENFFVLGFEADHKLSDKA